MPIFRRLLPLFLIFIFCIVVPLIFPGMLYRNAIDPLVIIGANIFLLLLTLLSFSIQIRGMQAKNPHVFVRGITLGMLLKMVCCIAIIILYVYFSGSAYNKRGVFIALFMYLLYLFAEVAILMKLNRKRHA